MGYTTMEQKIIPKSHHGIIAELPAAADGG
jgi:hypothetical protein